MSAPPAASLANRLGAESSAYLRQHRRNPVAWWPWGPEPFAEAARRRCPVLVSIGYSSCHWCHVMERESFEDSAIAERMNRELVCIKVDREERPDVDQIYMDAVVRLTGHGGWPLNVFCLPDGRPFFGGTYFPPQRAYGRPSWSDVVEAIAKLYRHDEGRVLEQADQIVTALRAWPDLEAAEPGGTAGLGALASRLMDQADPDDGGFGDAPKFPMPPSLHGLLDAACLGVGSPESLAHLCFTLVCMSRGGLYDHLGGGFHRYSTDRAWIVPHFEKMLYDQGQLLRVYAEAFRQTREAKLAWPVAETIDFLAREMCDPRGGFYASQDADSEGEEGRFYVWSPDEIRAVLGPESGAAFCEAYGVREGGSFEATGKSVLHDLGSGDRGALAEERALLLAARARRVSPETDRKQITAWIGYAISGIATAAATWHRADWLALAERAVGFVETDLGEGTGELRRVFDGQEARIPAFLDDLAAMLCARLDLFRASGDGRHAEAALRLAERICADFYAPERAELYFARAGDPTLIFRPQTDSDGATPSAAGLAVLGLVRVAALTGRSELAAVAEAVLARFGPLMARAPQALPTLTRASAWLGAGLGIALVLGDPEATPTRALAARARELLGCEELVVVLRPDASPAWLDPGWLEGRSGVSEPTAWICRGRACSLPATHPEQLALP